MSAAGYSASVESERQAALAAEHRRAAEEAEQASARYRIAATTEASVARRLVPLSAVGHHLLPDRAWPGTRSGAQVDLIVVGPGGVFIVDTKAWKEVTIAGGHIFRGQADVTDDLDNLADLAYGTEHVMAEVGLAPGEVHAVAVLAGQRGIKEMVGTVDVVGEHDILRYITGRGTRLTGSQVDAVLGAALRHFPVLGAPAPVVAAVPEPVLAEQSIQPDLISEEEVREALLEGMLAAPIEEWMSFLHPDQAKVVRRSFSGPSRIRGAAGTGKTVVGLHRAAYLARQTTGRVLVTTFVKSLPAVQETLMRRMAPAVVDRIDFVNAHAFAFRLLRERGIPCRVDVKAANAAFDAAWRTAPELRAIDPNEQYWRDEIHHVIKGRAITRFEAYADLARQGRRRILRIEQRRTVWQLYVDYEQRLRDARIHDFSDVISMAAASLRADPLDTYRSVIVDEAQDLSCETVRMLHSLVGDRDDGLTLIGDGRQTIYPGGFTLAEAGISLTGRGVVMTTNYRNTAEIVDFASHMVDDLELNDLEGRLDAAASVIRHGEPPRIHRAASRADHDAALVAHLKHVTSFVGTGLGDVAVLGLDHQAVAHAKRALDAAGIPHIDLDEYRGEPGAAVKVGTVKRGKGLEFKQVAVVGVPRATLADAVPDDAGALERHEFARRELYVGMTRARDGLWVGVLP
ncbi:nuclease-related domain-containing DEAD/DEAH box helicase [Salinibacterium soli]|uniref:DNA 3'-5' helicase n=1 Tax=Antiquaquibacter soli TaxID=3064523 RepID=A0ABT9BPD5_9MICO|nr:UvrD-helicase domain-containing protein [Protaetiibacter sp. WY-16]MDO7882444.1 UvrD-helicase domain-containing protein [Protaetiibacter sp. WY-16]